MVGVPGRSKGCHACRKQKIACSQERPECAICLRAGRKCPGYQRDRIFINLGPSEDGLQGAKPATHVSLEQPRSSRKNSHERHTVKTEEMKNPQASNTLEQLLGPQRTLTLAAYRQQLLGRFLSRYATSKTGLSEKEIAEQHWLPLVTNRPCVSRALDVAAVAFCTAKLGRAARDKTLITESLNLYGRGLRELQRALYDPRQMYADDTLGACVLLAMYEAFECPTASQKGYLSHVAGCSRLIQLRGPAAHTEGLGHWIFVSYRFLATLEALGSKETFLDEPAWMTLPFQTRDKTPINRLLDLMLEAPAIMRRGDQLDFLPNLTAKYESAIGIMTSLYNLDARMHAFYAELEASTPGPLFREKVAPYDEFHTRDLFPILYTFDDIRMAGTLALYWASMTMLSAGILRMHPILGYLQSVMSASQLAEVEEIDAPTPMAEEAPAVNITVAAEAELGTESEGTAEFLPVRDPASDVDASTQPSTEPTSTSNTAPTTPSATTVQLSCEPPPYDPHDFAYYARQVCKTVPYCLGDDDCDLGLGAVTAPLHIVLETLRPFGEVYALEVKWTRAMLERVRGRGLGIVDFLSGMDEDVSDSKK